MGCGGRCTWWGGWLVCSEVLGPLWSRNGGFYLSLRVLTLVYSPHWDETSSENESSLATAPVRLQNWDGLDLLMIDKEWIWCCGSHILMKAGWCTIWCLWKYYTEWEDWTGVVDAAGSSNNLQTKPIKEPRVGVKRTSAWVRMWPSTHRTVSRNNWF